jgi:spartin
MLMLVSGPVEILLPQEGEGNQINVTNASEEYLKMAKHPAYKDSTLVQNAAVASRLIVTGSGWLANQMASGADNFTKKTKPNPKPMTFTPTTQARVRKLNGMTQGAVNLSAKTVGQVTKHAQNLGATLARRGDQQKSLKRDKEGYKPGLLNKSMMAFSTIADGVDYASRNLLASGSSAATQVVGHRYGEDAKNVAGGLVGGVKNVGLVYVDAAGVSRRAVIKYVTKIYVHRIASLIGFLDPLRREWLLVKHQGAETLLWGAETVALFLQKQWLRRNLERLETRAWPQ